MIETLISVIVGWFLGMLSTWAILLKPRLDRWFAARQQAKLIKQGNGNP